MKNSIILIILLISSLSIFADENYQCDRSIVLDSLESAYGPPSEPFSYVDIDLYNNEKEWLKNNYNFEVLFRLGYMAYKLSLYTEAIHYFSKAEDFIIDKKIPDADCSGHFYTYYALIYEEIGDLEKAKYYYYKQDDIYYIHLIEARILRKTKKYKQAEYNYLLAQSVLLYEMLNYDPFKEISEMYYEISEYQLAQKYITKYINCAKYELETGGLGYIPGNSDHIKEAIEFLELINNKIKTNHCLEITR